jgi:hypothetical protein
MTNHPSDRKAAYSGLIFGVVAMFIMVYTIVTLTNKHYAGEKGAKAAAGTTK